jgi:hypothetical protein
VAKPITVLRSITSAIALALGASFQLADHYRLFRKLRLIPGPEGHFHYADVEGTWVDRSTAAKDITMLARHVT